MKYRKPQPHDEHLLAKWISCDDFHASTCSPDFWMTEEKGRVECFVPEDDTGVVFYARSENVMRLHLQFPPVSSREEKHRLAKAIDQFTEDIKRLTKDKYKQLIFESTSESLIEFLKKRGFRQSQNEYVLDL